MTQTADRPIALVTGGAKRVGRAIALTLARAGCDVMITYNRSRMEAEETAGEIRGLRVGGIVPKVELVELDLSDLSAVERVGEGLAASQSRLDILVHNASVYGARALGQVDAEHLLEMYRVNAGAPLILSKHLSPLLVRSALPGGGAIVAMCDMHVLGRPRKELSAYAMSKAALVEMVRTLARELAPRVRVNGVAPGVVAFPESGHESDPEMQRAYLSRVPLGRSGTPEEAAEVVRWLAMDATYVTGEVVRVDGGRWLA